MEKFKTLNGYEVKDEFARNQSQNALTRIGDLTELDTTDKTSVVNAINEVFNDISGDSTKIGDLNNLHTTDKTNLVNAINETDDYAHTIRQVDIGIPDGQTFDDECIWSGETFVSEITNIITLFNNLWWIYDVGSLQLNNALSYMYTSMIDHPNFQISQEIIGGNGEIENRIDLSTKNVMRSIVKTTHTFTSSSDILNIPIYQVQVYNEVTPPDEPYKVIIDDVYSINTTTEYEDQGLTTICDGNQVFHATQCFMYLDDDPNSPNYNWYVLGVQPKNSSGIIGISTKVIAKVEYSTKKETIVNP